jgi:hypothetical protein
MKQKIQVLCEVHMGICVLFRRILLLLLLLLLLIIIIIILVIIHEIHQYIWPLWQDLNLGLPTIKTAMPPLAL